MMQLAFGPCK